MAKRKLSQVRQEYLKQEKRIRNIVKREAKRGIEIDISKLLPQTPQRITRSAVQRLREITPTRARYYGVIDYGNSVVSYSEFQSTIDRILERNRIARKFNKKFNLSTDDGLEVVEVPKSIYGKLLLASDEIRKVERRIFEREIKEKEEQKQEILFEPPKIEIPEPPQEFIDDYYSEYEEPSAEEYTEPQEGELGYQAAEGLDDYYRAQEEKEKAYDLPYESDTVIQHICEMLNMSNYAEAKLFLHMVNSRINEIGKDELTRIFTSNARDTRKWVETVCFDSKQERRQDALGSLMYLLYGDEEIPKYYKDTKLAIEYEGAKYSKNRAYRKSVAKKFKDNSL